MLSFKQNTFTKQNTSFFKDFTPYTLANGIVATETLSEMISYDITARVNPSTVNYQLGTSNTYEFTLSVKNLTRDITLDIEIEHENYFQVQNNNYTLTPEQIQESIIQLNKSVLNEANRGLNFLTQVTIVVKNRPNDTFATKRVDINELQQISLPNIIDII